MLTTFAAEIVTFGFAFSKAAMTGFMTGVVKVKTFIVRWPLSSALAGDASAVGTVIATTRAHAPIADHDLRSRERTDGIPLVPHSISSS